MVTWNRYPTIYEINTWVWLTELATKHGTSLNLANVPTIEWDAIAAYGFDAVWLMGVWERSPAGISIANQNDGLLEDFKRVLPDFRLEDNVGSPYCIKRYVVDQHLGGPTGLSVARKELAKRGIGLLLDFVPNHVAPDHPWVSTHPEYFIQGTPDDALNNPESYVSVGEIVFARGRDPYFPAWPDVLQLNAFQPRLRQAVAETLDYIASQCDGVRCDMAMLLTNAVFERTWGDRGGLKPASEFWTDVIPTLKKAHPNFLFIAETYWDLEWELQQQGFDFCYDKRLYDRLEKDTPESVRLHLCADAAYQDKLLRFLENHDEPRAAAAFFPAKERAAAVVTSTLPGARLFHEGQFDGRKARLPVFLGRRPNEIVDTEMQEFYGRLLTAIQSPGLRVGRWSLCERTGWPDNWSYLNVVAWLWKNDEVQNLVIVNLSDQPAQATVHVNWDELEGKTWTLTDMLSGISYERSGDELLSPGLYVELQPWEYYIFDCRGSLDAATSLLEPVEYEPIGTTI